MHPTKVAFWGGKSGTCTPKNYIFVVFKANSEGENALSTMLFSPEWVFRSRVLEQYLHCKLRGWRKVFTTNLMGADLPQNTPKTRKPIAERTSHKWHGYTTRGCSSLCCTKQLLLLPRNARNAQNLLAEKGLPRMARMNTDT